MGVLARLRLTKNTNNGSTNWPNMPLKRTKRLRLGIIIVMTLLNSIMCFFTSLYRGTNGPGGWAIREAEGNPNRTEYVWLFDVDLKVNTGQRSSTLGLQRILVAWLFRVYFILGDPGATGIVTYQEKMRSNRINRLNGVILRDDSQFLHRSCYHARCVDAFLVNKTKAFGLSTWAKSGFHD